MSVAGMPTSFQQRAMLVGSSSGDYAISAPNAFSLVVGCVSRRRGQTDPSSPLIVFHTIVGAFPAFMFADCPTQRFRRLLREYFPVLDRKTPELSKSMTGRDLGDGHGAVTRPPALAALGSVSTSAGIGVTIYRKPLERLDSQRRVHHPGPKPVQEYRVQSW